MAKYHINPKTGDVKQCRASKGFCPFGDAEAHYSSADEARQAYEDSQLPSGEREPIILNPAPPLAFDNFSFYNFDELRDATDIEELDYYLDHYSELTSVDSVKMTELLTGLTRSEWPSDLEALHEANKAEWGDAANWSFEVGYYEGDPAILEPPASAEPRIKEWYYSKPNAADHDGILEHVREKGYETTGLPPVEAVKKMLREENGKILKHVERASRVRALDINFSRIDFAKVHYDKIGAKKPQKRSPHSKEFIGVLKRSAPGRFRLLDGHHRLKWAQNNGRTSGLFIVIE